MESGEPAFTRKGAGFKKKDNAVGGVEVGACLLVTDGSAGSGFGKAVQGLKDHLMSRVFPGEVGKRGLLLQVLGILCGKALTSKE